MPMRHYISSAMGIPTTVGFCFLFISVAIVSLTHAIEMHEEEGFGTVIGIDFGGSHSRVAVMQKNDVTVIMNEAGSRSIPSYVAFTDQGRLVGDAAKRQAATDPSRTIFDFKRMMGVNFLHPDVQTGRNELPYDIIEKKGRPHIQVNLDNSIQLFSLEDVASTIFADLKQTAESYLGEKVTHAVIAVPDYFNDTQRQAVKGAGAIAGLNVLRVINEPTAAAIAYGIDKAEHANAIIYDLGGRTLNVALIDVDRGVFEILATARDTHIGGEYINDNIFTYLVHQYNSKHVNTPFMTMDTVNRLHSEIEKAKQTLSYKTSAHIEVKGFNNGGDLSEILTRETIEDINKDLLERSLGLVGEVLEKGSIKKDGIDFIILAGGSSHIPKIRYLLEDSFQENITLNGMNPDELVSIGAAVQGNVLAQPWDECCFPLEFNPLSLGIKTTGGLMHNMIPRNMVIPARKRGIFSTTVDNQSIAMIEIFSGERLHSKENYYLGALNLTEISQAPKGVPEIEVVFIIDADGQLNVTATDMGSGKTVSLSITVGGEKHPEYYSEIDQHIQLAEIYYEEDIAMLNAVEEELGLKNLTYRRIDPPRQFTRPDGPLHNEL